MFEDSADSDFITLMRAYDFAKANGFSFERCRTHGINAQVARQVEQTCQQILTAAQQQGLQSQSSSTNNDDALRRCLMAGFIDQLAKRRTPGKPECDLTDQRQGQLVRESVVRDADFFVVANLRETPLAPDAPQPRHPPCSPRGSPRCFPSISAPRWSTPLMPKTNASPP
jgi:hypothetical protein